MTDSGLQALRRAPCLERLELRGCWPVGREGVLRLLEDHGSGTLAAVTLDDTRYSRGSGDGGGPSGPRRDGSQQPCGNAAAGAGAASGGAGQQRRGGGTAGGTAVAGAGSGMAPELHAYDQRFRYSKEELLDLGRVVSEAAAGALAGAPGTGPGAALMRDLRGVLQDLPEELQKAPPGGTDLT